MAVALPSVPISDANMTMGFVTERHTNQTGASAFYRDGVNPTYQTWNVKFGDITAAQAESLRTFFATYGKVSTISWTPPGQTLPLLFRTTSDARTSHVGFDQWDVEIDLEQVFDYE